MERSDLVRQNLGSNDTVVLLDDFSGTGKQVCDAWSDPETAFGELLAEVGKVYLVLVAATKDAKRRISDETPMSVMPAHDLDEKDQPKPGWAAVYHGDTEKRFEAFVFPERGRYAVPAGLPGSQVDQQHGALH